ncbi:P-type ATPase [Planoprotostelium fungivorum]|uniref:P-type ATPase n=1 Tax=Planoprotostelium fungivorum TaxID=1890364 RepID=A0A2P6NJD0_9EUKA|nr:P-type ATPase [Planoprotostelium fungivorum]
MSEQQHNCHCQSLQKDVADIKTFMVTISDQLSRLQEQLGCSNGNETKKRPAKPKTDTNAGKRKTDPPMIDTSTHQNVQKTLATDRNDPLTTSGEVLEGIRDLDIDSMISDSFIEDGPIPIHDKSNQPVAPAKKETKKKSKTKENSKEESKKDTKKTTKKEREKKIVEKKFGEKRSKTSSHPPTTVIPLDKPIQTSSSSVPQQIINPDRREGEAPVLIPMEIARVLLEHQLEGARHMWKCATNPAEEGSGCIIADSMGLGKTIQTITFITTWMKKFREISRKQTALIIVPATVITNWTVEFEKFVYPQNRPKIWHILGGKEINRVEVVTEWLHEGGVMIMSYELFRIMITTNEVSGMKSDLDLIVLDEGHRISNFNSQITEAVEKLKTKRRIILTGYPLQNRLIEYWCMVNFVRPNYLGDRSIFKKTFEEVIAEGLNLDAKDLYKKAANRRLYVLYGMLSMFVLRRSEALLKQVLRGPLKYEYTIMITPSPIQIEEYNRYLSVREIKVSDVLLAQHMLLSILNHPDVLKAKMEKLATQSGQATDEFTSHMDYSWVSPGFKDLVFQWKDGPKLTILMDIIMACKSNQKKALVFTQSLQTLTLIEDAIQLFNSTAQEKVTWFRLDGSTRFEERQTMIDDFNDSTKNIDIFLLSIRAGGVGINLTPASRVILYDVNWNPLHENEAINRAYRYGQIEDVHVYRLITSGSIEHKMYNRQLKKQHLFFGVIDAKNQKRTILAAEVKDLISELETQTPMGRENLENWLKTHNQDPVFEVATQRNAEYIAELTKHAWRLQEENNELIDDRHEREQLDKIIDAVKSGEKGANKLRSEFTTGFENGIDLVKTSRRTSADVMRAFVFGSDAPEQLSDDSFDEADVYAGEEEMFIEREADADAHMIEVKARPRAGVKKVVQPPVLNNMTKKVQGRNEAKYELAMFGQNIAQTHVILQIVNNHRIICESEPKMGPEPRWRPLTISLSSLGGSIHNEFTLQLCDGRTSHDKPRLIGKKVVTLKDLQSSGTTFLLEDEPEMPNLKSSKIGVQRSICVRVTPVSWRIKNGARKSYFCERDRLIEVHETGDGVHTQKQQHSCQGCGFGRDELLTVWKLPRTLKVSPKLPFGHSKSSKTQGLNAMKIFSRKKVEKEDEDHSKEYQADEHLLTLEELAKNYSANINSENPKASAGLERQDAEDRLLRDGKNKLTPPKQTPEIIKFLKEFANYFMILLEFAALLCLIAYLLDRTQPINLYLAIVLIVIVILTCIMSYVQARKSGKLMESFKNLLPPKCTVVRGGHATKIVSEDLVIGDIVYVCSGDKVPADLRLIQCQDLKVDNSSLTGESEPQSRDAKQSKETNPMESKNICFYGTLAVDGSAYGLVMRTGDRTLLGQIVKLTSGKATQTTLEKDVLRFVKFISILALVMGAVFFAVGMGIDYRKWITNLINTIGVIVANVPEGLPATVTVCLTIAARRLAAKQVWVKELESVETLGATTLICSDKTGTLTQNRMTAVHVWYDDEIRNVKHLVPSEDEQHELLEPKKDSCSSLFQVAAICSRAQFEQVDITEELRKKGITSIKDVPIAERAIIGDASETALLRMCESYFDAEMYRQNFPKVFEIPFNSTNKFQLSIHTKLQEKVIMAEPDLVRSGSIDAIRERLSVDRSRPSISHERREDFAQPRQSISDVVRHSVEAVRTSIQMRRVEQTRMAALAAERESIDKLRKQQFTQDFKNEELSKISKNIDSSVHIKSRILALKGAPEIVLAKCSHIMIDGRPQPLTQEWKDKFQKTVETLASGGERVLGFSILPFEDETDPASYNIDKQNFPTKDLTFVGLISLMDPPRPSVPSSVIKCRMAGVKIAMVTGDHPLTAKAIAKQIGLLTYPTREEIAASRNISPDQVPEDDVHAVVVNGQTIRDYTEEDWARVVKKTQCVFARTSPQQKLVIVRHFQDNGEVVAVTGDGVNDSPALKQANIGIAMGIAGSDVAKEAADIILMDDNFSSITNGIEEGRVIFNNLQKSIMYTLSHLVPEVTPFLLSLALGLPVGLSTQLILCIDLGTELAPAIALAYELPESNIMAKPPRDTKTQRLVSASNLIYAYLHIGVIEALAGLTTFFYVMNYHGFESNKIWFKYQYFVTGCGDLNIDGKIYSEDFQLNTLAEAQTAFFIAIVYCQMANLLACKTTSLSIFQHGFKNMRLNIALIIEVCIMVVIVFGLRVVFNSRPPPGFCWLIPLPFALFIVGHVEIIKWVKRVRARRSSERLQDEELITPAHAAAASPQPPTEVPTHRVYMQFRRTDTDGFIMATFPTFSIRTPAQSSLEDEVIRSVFGVSLEPLAGAGIVFLPNLSSQISALSNLASSFFTQPAPMAQTQSQNPMAIDLASILSNLSGVTPTQNNPTSNPQNVNPPAATVTAPNRAKVDRSMIQTIIEEKAKITNSTPVIHLIEARARSSALRKNVTAELKPFYDQLIDFLLTNTITLGTKIIMQEMTRPPQPEQSNVAALLESESKDFLTCLITSLPADQRENHLRYLVAASGYFLRVSVVGKNVMDRAYVKPLKSIHFLFETSPQAFELFAKKLLVEEVAKSSSATGREIETYSTLSPLLSMTSIITQTDNMAFRYASLVNREDTTPPKTSSEFSSVQNMFRSISDEPITCAHTIMKRVFLDKESKENGLRWLSAVLQLNDARHSVSLSDPLFMETQLFLASDGFIANLTMLLFKFCKPFLPISADKFKLVNPQYCVVSPRFDWTRQPKLCDAGRSAEMSTSVEFNFITEIFFITYYCLHVGLHTLIERLGEYEKGFQQCVDYWKERKSLLGEAWREDKDAKKMADSMDHFLSMTEGLDTILKNPEFIHSVLLFVRFCFAFMEDLTQKPNAEVYFSSMPEFMVRDLCDLLFWITRYSTDSLFKEADFVPASVDWAIQLLNGGSRYVKSSLIRSKLAGYLHDLMHLRSHPSYGGHLKFSISGSRLINTCTIGLINIYNDVDVVEGLDVDKETGFSKYGTRLGVSKIFNDLWENPIFLKDFLSHTEDLPFQKMIRILLQDSMHHLDDSLGRLMDIRQLQLAMEDKTEWDSQDDTMKKEREGYYKSQQKTAKGFMSMANSSLDFVIKMAQTPRIKAIFLKPNVLPVFSGFLNHFFDVLCGPKRSNLKVKEPEKYNFSPKELLRKISTITTTFVSEPSFISCVLSDGDFSPSTLYEARTIVDRQGLLVGEALEQFTKFVASVQPPDVSAPVSSHTEDPLNQMEISEPEEEDISERYAEKMKDMVFDSCSMADEEGKYNHHYASQIQGGTSANKSKMERILKEMTMLSESLPVSVSSSIFVRADEERVDAMKAIIIGPEGTPYSGGVFEFHIFFPPNYPHDPLLINLETTGNGTVRFNPNLYNDGKVCLSLLGTWHGGRDSTSKWNPVSSNLHQVLVSIQALILLDEPYYNEPAYESQRGTKEGDKRSFEYNEPLRLATIRHAMITQVRSPPQGFEEVVRHHFDIQRGRLVRQCEKWVGEASETFKPKMEKALEDLKRELLLGTCVSKEPCRKRNKLARKPKRNNSWRRSDAQQHGGGINEQTLKSVFLLLSEELRNDVEEFISEKECMVEPGHPGYADVYAENERYLVFGELKYVPVGFLQLGRSYPYPVNRLSVRKFLQYNCDSFEEILDESRLDTEFQRLWIKQKDARATNPEFNRTKPTIVFALMGVGTHVFVDSILIKPKTANQDPLKK